MKYGSVCSGIEAATVAWHPLGWEPQWFCEFEKYPSQVLAHHYPGVPNLHDMTTIEERPEYHDRAINLLVGGTPCQSFSIAGLRKGLADDRGNLALKFCQILREKQPEWFVWENVPGVLSSNSGRDFAAILSGFRECGYGFAYRILDAQYFGVAQRRRRVFVVGHLGDWRPAAAVLFESESVRGYSAPRRKKREEIAPTIRSGAPNGGAGHGARSGDSKDELIVPVSAPDHRYSMDNEFNSYNAEDATGTLIKGSPTGGGKPLPAVMVEREIAGTIDAAAGQSRGAGTNPGLCVPVWPADVAPTLDAHYGDKQGLENQHINSGGGCLSVARCLTGSNQRIDAETETLIPYQGGFPDTAHALTGEGHDASEDGTGRGTPIIPAEPVYPINTQVALRHEAMGEGTGMGIGDDGDPAYTLQANHHHAVAFAQNSRDELREMPYIGALAAKPGMKQQSFVRALQAVRRLTPVECERLQGFPDNYTNIPVNNRGGYAADGPRYKALGNSMAVPCMRWIGERIEAVNKILVDTSDTK